ncbi:hypothetical protein HU200_035855 [Digitaria exilis]|uniref:Uncharacterized protein n=1 Tax=Digitaria exilis TaxID=1010633 RepID=A0A835EKS1_9POAL|nr:hypothetical protein HU200_035855 [Digitaria exilis]
MKCELAGEREKYNEFISIMREFKNRLQNLTGLVDDVKALLAGHPNLIRGFSEFLPWDYIRAHGPADAEGSGTTSTGV